MAFDILIKNARIIDGTGGPEVRGALGILHGRIEEVGPSVSGSAREVIDAEGKIVCPGFIDITNHSDVVGTLFTHPTQESMLRQGVTTIIGGNCGSSVAPLMFPEAINYLQKWRPEDVSVVNWLSLEEFLDSVEDIQPAVNFGTLVGFGILRKQILRNENRAFTYEDFLKLKILLEDALDEGAFGLSTGLVYAHEHSAKTEELLELCAVLKKFGAIYKTHLRSESKAILGAINEVIMLGRESGVPISISHFKAIGRSAWRDFDKGLQLIQKAHESGVKIRFDMYPYITTGSFLYLLLPAAAYEGGFQSLFHRLKKSEIRINILKALEKQTLHYDAITVATAWKTKGSVGKTIQHIADSIHVSPAEAITELLLANEGRVTIFGKTVRPEHVKETLQHPLCLVATDGSGYNTEYAKSGELVHPRAFGAFPRFFRLAVNNWKTLSWPEAIHKATKGPADLLGIKRRGSLVRGMYAANVAFF